MKRAMFYVLKMFLLLLSGSDGHPAAGPHRGCRAEAGAL